MNSPFLIIDQDEVIPSSGLKKPKHLHCTVPYNDSTLTLTVRMLVSEDETVEDHYPVDHPINKNSTFLHQSEWN